MNPARVACAAAAARDDWPSLRRMFATCRCTVCSESTSDDAISRFERPAATSLRTSASRLESGEFPLASADRTPLDSKLIDVLLGVPADFRDRLSRGETPELEVHASPQRYEWLDDGRVRFVSLDSDFTADLELDEDGFLTRYPGLAERVSSP